MAHKINYKTGSSQSQKLLLKADRDRASTGISKVKHKFDQVVHQGAEVVPSLLQHPLHAHIGVGLQQALLLLHNPLVHKLVQGRLNASVHHLKKRVVLFVAMVLVTSSISSLVAEMPNVLML